jgi:hypothetical protein
MVCDEDDAEIKLVDFGFAEKADGFSLEGHMGVSSFLLLVVFLIIHTYGRPYSSWIHKGTEQFLRASL